LFFDCPQTADLDPSLNLYQIVYKAIFRRTSLFLEAVLRLFLSLSFGSLLEVFTEPFFGSARYCEKILAETQNLALWVEIVCPKSGAQPALHFGGVNFHELCSMTSSCLFNRGTTFSQTVTDKVLFATFLKLKYY